MKPLKEPQFLKGIGIYTVSKMLTKLAAKVASPERKLRWQGLLSVVDFTANLPTLR